MKKTIVLLVCMLIALVVLNKINDVHNKKVLTSNNVVENSESEVESATNTHRVVLSGLEIGLTTSR